MKRIIYVGCFFLLGFLCLSKSQGTEKPGDGGKVLAVVGDEKIDEKYLEQKIQTYPRQVIARVGRAAMEPKVIDDIIENKIFAKAAREIKLEEKPNVQFRIKDAIEGILAAEYQSYLLEKALPSEEELKKYYEENKAKFNIPEAIKVKHIAVKTEKEAKEVLAKLKKGADFGELAGKLSIHQTPNKDGDLGWVGRGSLLPEIEAVAFSMVNNLNKPSKIIQGAGLFHIVKVEDYRPETIVPFEKARDQILPVLAPQKQAGVVDEARKKLKERYEVKVFYTGGVKDSEKDSKK